VRGAVILTLLAAGLLVGSAFGASTEGELGAAGGGGGSPTFVAHGDGDGDERPARRAVPRRAADAGEDAGDDWSAPPAPPAPPAAPAGGSMGAGVSVTIRDGRIRIDGVADFVLERLALIQGHVAGHRDLSNATRRRLSAQLARAQATVSRRLASLDALTPAQLEREVERMARELERDLDRVEEALAEVGDRRGPRLTSEIVRGLATRALRQSQDAHRARAAAERARAQAEACCPDGDHADASGHHARGADADDADDADGDAGDAGDGDGDEVVAEAVVVAPGTDGSGRVDETRMRMAGALILRPEQQAQILRVRTTLARDVAAARKQLTDAQQRLDVALRDLRASDVEIARYVDQVSQQEAAIRKARILAWVGTRRLLDDVQRRQLEAAARADAR
jgi:hypothetical protein